jgi:hypothetical protein
MIFAGLQSIFLLVAGAFWIFILWILWKIVQSLKGIDASLKEIARGQQNRA